MNVLLDISIIKGPDEAIYAAFQAFQAFQGMKKPPDEIRRFWSAEDGT